MFWFLAMVVFEDLTVGSGLLRTISILLNGCGVLVNAVD